MEHDKNHILNYQQLTKVLIGLLLLTAITVYVSGLHLGAFSVGVALLIASVKVFIVLTFFMHLKFESKFIKLMVSGVFGMYALVVLITFIDYFFRS
jgi:cytochrome c oxidase subunit 4